VGYLRATSATLGIGLVADLLWPRHIADGSRLANKGDVPTHHTNANGLAPRGVLLSYRDPAANKLPLLSALGPSSD
jgi:hypothetical protein